MDAEFNRLIEAHSEFEMKGEPVESVIFEKGDWNRKLVAGQPGKEAINGSLYGLVELADNNPLVCADFFSVPGPVATLGLIGLGPLVRAGLVLDDPVVQISFDRDAIDLAAGLQEMGWRGDVVLHVDVQEGLGSVLAAVCMAEIAVMDDYSELDELFHEAYGRSFFVREADALLWDAEQVRGKDHACYTLRVSPFEDRALVTVLVMADRDGKCGAAQLVHAMNVMCGFEESLGLDVPA
ncbi:hypothetical protein CCB80_03960 [Armatimonadetes bacterium Uphvl-Ar1]|nr:hypothetical protein CCB80_03960 [Armatimonadetes bacterium Uphvl-Ar1]